MHTKLKTMKKQCLLLAAATVLESITAITLVYCSAIAWGNRLKLFDCPQPGLIGEEDFNFTLYWFIYPAVCLVLLGVLIHLIRKAPPTGALHKTSLFVLIVGVLLPSFLFILCGTPVLEEWYSSLVSIFLIWIPIGTFPLNILLFYNLHRYTKAIRYEKQHTENQIVSPVNLT